MDFPWIDTGYDREYDISLACFNIALGVIDEDPGTTNHAERLELANLILSEPRRRYLELAAIADANTWNSAVSWETATNDQIRTAITNIWTDVAVATYG